MDTSKFDYAVSARLKPEDFPITLWLNENYSKYLPVTSVFGFVEYTPLYGGREYLRPEISADDVKWLYDNGVGLRLPLQNTLTKFSHYNAEKSFLKKYHRSGNSVIISQDWLANKIREDFPLYKIEGSIIRQSLEHSAYDTIVPDFRLTLEDIKEIPKNKVRLFVNAFCAYTCKNRPCWKLFSALNLKQNIKWYCEHAPWIEYKFDLEAFKQAGYTKFKVLQSWQ